MAYKNYPVYIRKGIFRKQVIGNIWVDERLEKQGRDFDTYKVEYLDITLAPHIIRLIKNKFAKEQQEVKE